LADLAVAGAGMAGLVAAAEARRLGAHPVVFEKLDRPGGSMRLSSGVVWRHRDFSTFREECRGGDERLQRRLFERLDDDLRWLESLGAPVVERETGNELTAGVRFDVEGLTAALSEAAGEVRLGTPLTEPPGSGTLILATGGFGASRELLREHLTPEADHVLLRAATGSTGDGLRLGLAAGAAQSDGLGDVYARAMPAPPARVRPTEFVALSQLYARHARVTNERGERHDNSTWSEVDTAAWMARQPRARAWFRVEDDALPARVRERSVGDMVTAAEAAGAPVERDGTGVTVECVAGITTTLGGLAIDEQGEAAPGVFACGADAGGIATGGYASGLAAALVFGRLAARAALGESP
jgi:succinate dehydrogenase/fumarate reductase flavoprotein subunit